MPTVAVLVPDPDDLTYHLSWQPVLERLTGVLAGASVTADPKPWTHHEADVGGLDGYGLILPLLAWGYHREPDRWLAACDRWAASGLPFANPAEVIRWNTDKIYLDGLARQGVAGVPTEWLDRVDAEGVEAARGRLGGGTLIVKPRISGGAWRTEKLEPGQRLSQPFETPVLVQPFLPAIETEGELSLLFFGGRLSHAVRKRAASGDFRIQTQYGGDYQPETPSSEAVALAEQALALAPGDLLYARVDMVTGDDGRLKLMELELIEPDFYLAQAPDHGTAFAQAVLARI